MPPFSAVQNLTQIEQLKFDQIHPIDPKRSFVIDQFNGSNADLAPFSIWIVVEVATPSVWQKPTQQQPSINCI
jgi:hypothetical protein